MAQMHRYSKRNNLELCRVVSLYLGAKDRLEFHDLLTEVSARTKAPRTQILREVLIQCLRNLAQQPVGEKLPKQISIEINL